MANSLLLSAGQVYQLKVTKHTDKGKTITKQDGFKYQIFITTVEDKNGNTAKCEYLCREGTCQEVFPIGVYQYIRCGFVSNLGTPEIEPAEEPSVGLGHRYRPETADVVKDQPVDGAPEMNAYSVKIAGSSAAFAMGFAKDILCAEIGQQQFPYVSTDEDMQRMFKHAEMINDWMIERIKF